MLVLILYLILSVIAYVSSPYIISFFPLEIFILCQAPVIAFLDRILFLTSYVHCFIDIIALIYFVSVLGLNSLQVSVFFDYTYSADSISLIYRIYGFLSVQVQCRINLFCSCIFSSLFALICYICLFVSSVNTLFNKFQD